MENNTNNDINGKVGSAGAKPTTNNNDGEYEENPNLVNVEERQQEVEKQDEEESGSEVDQTQTSPPRQQPSRTPFTNLNQVDADLALARTLQEQERAYMMLRMNTDGSDYGSWEGGSYMHDDDEDDFDDPHDDSEGGDGDDDNDEGYDGTDVDDDDDEDAFDVHAHAEDGDVNNPSVEFDPADFSSDEAYARALQDAEDREMAARLFALAGINDRETDEAEDHGGHSQDTWEDVDPDELSYEELLALGEIVGTESRGLSADTIASLTSVKYKIGSSQNGSNDSCVICRLDYEDGETLTVLSCKHSYHSDCINNWLKINKVCPVCSAEVSTSGNS